MREGTESTLRTVGLCLLSAAYVASAMVVAITIACIRASKPRRGQD